MKILEALWNNGCFPNPIGHMKRFNRLRVRVLLEKPKIKRFIQPMIY
jgi:hypothetical protein